MLTRRARVWIPALQPIGSRVAAGPSEAGCFSGPAVASPLQQGEGESLHEPVRAPHVASRAWLRAGEKRPSSEYAGTRA
eukprot:4826472-Pleurochrysis_carterae.AAC.4